MARRMRSGVVPSAAASTKSSSTARVAVHSRSAAPSRAAPPKPFGQGALCQAGVLPRIPQGCGQCPVFPLKLLGDGARHDARLSEPGAT